MFGLGCSFYKCRGWSFEWCCRNYFTKLLFLSIPSIHGLSVCNESWREHQYQKGVINIAAEKLPDDTKHPKSKIKIILSPKLISQA